MALDYIAILMPGREAWLKKQDPNGYGLEMRNPKSIQIGATML